MMHINPLFLSSDQMLSIIQNGLMKTAAPKNIMIIGAGMAGLVAGSLLKEAGHKITIIEANDRVGGRIFTKRYPFLNNQYLELGAMRIPSIHHLTLAYIQKFKLPLNEFINSTPNDLMYVNNVLTTLKDYMHNPDILKFPVAPHEKGKTAEELLLLALGPILDFINQDPVRNLEIVIEKYDQYSMDYFLRYNPVGLSLSTGAIDMIKAIIGIEGFPELSFTSILMEINVLFSKDLKLYEITGGTDLLPNAFLPQLKNDIILHQKLTKIVQSDHNVTLYTEHTKALTKHRITCDLVICTIPFTVLNFVEIYPIKSISYAKWKAIRELHYTDSVKTGLQFKTRFWEKLGFFGGKITTDLPIKFSYLPSHEMGMNTTGIILASYTWGDDAFIWNRLSENQRINASLNNLARIYGDIVYKEFLMGSSISWSNNPYSGGAFVIFKPEQQRDFGKDIGTPEGRIHFAGEHTSNATAWIQGAIESGIRVAFEINQSLS